MTKIVVIGSEGNSTVYVLNSTNIRVVTSDDRSAYDGFAVVEYAKTTDTATTETYVRSGPY